jgi:hypothetical protein
MTFDQLFREKFPNENLDAFLRAPDWWPSSIETANECLAKLPGITVKEIGQSAGGRPIVAAYWGEQEPLRTTSISLHSAMAAAVGSPDQTKIFPEAFYGQQKRSRQVMVIQGAIHATEFEGTVAALNLLYVLAHGVDMRGKPWKRLRAEAEGMRIVVIPFANPDGRARVPIMHFAGASNDLGQAATMGFWKDGTPVKYPAHKNFYPLPLEQILFLGSYFNDAGYNLQYDFCLPRRQPETEALCQFYLDERPDVAVISHSNAGSLISNPDPYVPGPHQHQQSRVGAQIRARLLHEGYPGRRLTWAQLPGLGVTYMDQATSVYHCSGALPLLVEFPCGHSSNPVTLDQILDMGLLIFEELCFFGNRDGFRPLHQWDKTKV